MVVAVAIVLAIRLVVLVVIGDEVPQGEAVMHGQHVDPGTGLASGHIEDFR